MEGEISCIRTGSRAFLPVTCANVVRDYVNHCVGSLCCVHSVGSCGANVKYFICETTNAAYKGNFVFMFAGTLLPPFEREKRVPTLYVPTSAYDSIIVSVECPRLISNLQ